MSDESAPEMTQEDRLKAIAYQFILLYERWSEDRQVAAKQGADTAELVKLFTEQVKHFQKLESEVRQQMVRSIQNATASAVKTVSEEISKGANRAIENTARELANSVNDAQRTLNAYQNAYHHEVIFTQWKVIGASVVATIVTCVLIFWMILPPPILPLTDKQVKFLESGMRMEEVWPKLSKKEKEHWSKLAHEMNQARSS